MYDYVIRIRVGGFLSEVTIRASSWGAAEAMAKAQ